MMDLTGLNPQQRAAVTHGEGALLVLAGAGSGKTRVITHRIAWLIAEGGVDPASILAVTFTNKAASEMLSRIEQLIPRGNSKPTIGTFHSTSLRMLRRYADRLGYTRSFAIYDTADQLALVRRILKELSLADDAFPPRNVLSRISRAKNELTGPAEFEKENVDFFGSRVAGVYRLYQKYLKKFDAMDFDDLIGNYVELLRKHPNVRDSIRSRFRHVLIDEYQDTNHAQYQLIKLLTGEGGNVMAVGDEDQSIYRFRGADISNILNFERDFPGAAVVKLEQNYRSTGNILDAATGVVEQNVARKGKTLFTEGGEGEKVRVVTCETEREEAKFVVERILALRSEIPLREFAVLFRTNAQSRPFEEELLGLNLPYVVVGGMKFYERAEIKDILSYFRLTIHPHDDPALERVINSPTRGIGDVTVKAIAEKAAEEGSSLWTVIEGEMPFLSERARRAVAAFREIVHDLQRAVSNPLPEFFDYLLLRTDYRRSLEESKDPQDDARLENLEELMNSAREFWEANPGATLGDYIDSVSLVSDVDQYDDQKGVTLMTLHAAKGLEFRVVFLAGMEQGLLPHAQSKDEEAGIEEERRLCYVGMTRAREQLYCIHCQQRRIYGQFREQSRSPFLEEIPSRVTEEVMLAHGRRGMRDEPSWREQPIRQGYSSGSRQPGRSGGADARNVAG
ncbi:MAG: UvrD-helicase domain-containing protein, partial [Thermoanaerobaculia bacterium]